MLTLPSRSARVGAALAAALLLPTVAACGSGDSGSAAPSSASGASGGAAESGYPLTIKSAWGTATIPAKPKKVAVVSSGDQDMAYALGVTPIIAPNNGQKPMPYVAQARQKLGITTQGAYTTSDGKANMEAIAAAEPDVILATNAWYNGEEYAKLSQIAPVVAVATEADVQDMGWDDRTRLVGKALGLSDKAEEAIAGAKKVAADAVTSHPQWKGKTYTYVVGHPQQLSYMSAGSVKPGLFEDLGLVKTATAANVKESGDKISVENLKMLDGDTLFLAFPFVDEGGMDLKKLQGQKLWSTLPVVKEKRFGVIPYENGLASDVAYQDILSYPWVVEQMTPIIDKAVEGQGGS